MAPRQRGATNAFGAPKKPKNGFDYEQKNCRSGGFPEVTMQTPQTALSKVPAVTLLFWIIKLAATTLGETGGDAVTMSMDLGYLVGSLIFAALFAVMVIAQISARGFHPWLYWATITATTTLGTTVADFADRSLGIGYTGGVTLLSALLLISLLVWYRASGSVSASFNYHAEGGELLLDHDHVFADPRHRAR
jgi:uncharacterized membrane-anchored protein